MDIGAIEGEERVADDDGAGIDRPLGRTTRISPVCPQGRPVVEIDDRVSGAPALVEPREAGIGRIPHRQGARADPQHAAVADDLLGNIGRHDRGVGCPRASVEDDRRVCGRIERGEHNGGQPLRVGPDIGRVDAEASELREDERGEEVAADLRRKRRLQPEPRRCNGDVGRAPADGLHEGLRVREGVVRLLRIEVDTDASDRQKVKDHPTPSPEVVERRHRAGSPSTPRPT